MSTILIIGGSGTVGSATIAALRKKGMQAKCLTHSPEKVNAMPEGAKAVLGDLSKPASLREVFIDVENLFLITALSQNEAEQGINAVRAAKNADVRKIVYLSLPRPKDAVHIPHFRSKVSVEDALKSSKTAWTILRPYNFYQNDYLFKDAVLEYGIYPQPIGSKGINRVDVRDIADAAANILTAGKDYADQEFLLGHPQSWTGESTATIYSKHLGREVRYAGNDLNEWAKQAKTMMPKWMVHDMRIMFQYFIDKGYKAGPTELEKQKKVLGREPRAFDGFVQETVKAWKK